MEMNLGGNRVYTYTSEKNNYIMLVSDRKQTLFPSVFVTLPNDFTEGSN